MRLTQAQPVAYTAYVDLNGATIEELMREGLQPQSAAAALALRAQLGCRAQALVTTGSRLMRMTTGQATARSEITGKDGEPIGVNSTPDLGNLSVDEAAELPRLIRKAKAGPSVEEPNDG